MEYLDRILWESTRQPCDRQVGTIERFAVYAWWYRLIVSNDQIRSFMQTASLDVYHNKTLIENEVNVILARVNLYPAESMRCFRFFYSQIQTYQSNYRSTNNIFDFGLVLTHLVSVNFVAGNFAISPNI